MCCAKIQVQDSYDVNMLRCIGSDNSDASLRPCILSFRYLLKYLSPGPCDPYTDYRGQRLATGAARPAPPAADVVATTGCCQTIGKDTCHTEYRPFGYKQLLAAVDFLPSSWFSLRANIQEVEQDTSGP